MRTIKMVDSSRYEWDAELAEEMGPLLVSSVSTYSKIRDVLVSLIEVTRAEESIFAVFAGRQMSFLSSRVQSATLLLNHLQYWDVEVLMRSVIECATRFLFVCTRPSEVRLELIDEFEMALADVHHVERSSKARKAAHNAETATDETVFRHAALPPNEEAALRSRWTKAERLKLKQKWSFSEIVLELERIHEPTLDLSLYGSMLYGYAVGSHFVHADAIAMELVRDRALRSPVERGTLERAHFARLAVACPSLLFLCLKGMAHAVGERVETTAICADLKSLFERCGHYGDIFSESQAQFYASVEASAKSESETT